MLKNLIPPPIVAAIIATLVFLLSGASLGEEQSMLQIWLITIAVTGALLIDLAAFYTFFKLRTTINPLQPEKTRRLVTIGIYRYSRNPMYVSIVFWLLAFGAYIATPLILPGAICFIWYITTFQIHPEEKVLLEKFGEDFEQYQKTVRMWL